VTALEIVGRWRIQEPQQASRARFEPGSNVSISARMDRATAGIHRAMKNDGGAAPFGPDSRSSIPQASYSTGPLRRQE